MPSLTTLSERLAHALDLRRMSQNQLDRDAALGRGYANRLINGSRGTRMDPLMMERIAKALDVEYKWLATGEGPIRVAHGAASLTSSLEATGDLTPPSYEPDDRYPSRAQVIAEHRRAGTDPRALELVMRQALDAPSDAPDLESYDPGYLYWQNEVLAAVRRIELIDSGRRKEASLVTPGPGRRPLALPEKAKK